MSRLRALLLFAALSLAGCGGETATAVNEGAASNAAAPPRVEAPIVRVRLTTEMGDIVVALDTRHAPITSTNFLAYVDQHRLDGTTFYRASRTRGATGRGFVQGGIRRNYRLGLRQIAHEPTSRTGLRHVAGTISMARLAPGTAMGDFFITVGPIPSMDAHGDEPGFAAFGHVEEGMDTVRRILAAPTAPNAGAGAMRGQMIEHPVRIVRAARAD